MQKIEETWVQSLGREDPLEEDMTTHSNILGWRILWTKEPNGIQSMGWQRVGHDWSNLAHSIHGMSSVYFCVCIYLSESEVAQSCLTLCDPMDCSLSGFSVHGILQARILEWVIFKNSNHVSTEEKGKEKIWFWTFHVFPSIGLVQKKVVNCS